MSPNSRLQATSTGDALAQILTSRAETNLTDDVTAQIATLAAGVDSHYAATGEGTYTVAFTDAGADLRLTELGWFNDPVRRDDFLASFVPNDPSDPPTAELQDRAEDAEAYLPAPRFHVACAFADRTPISFTDELVISGGRVRWVKRAQDS